MSELGDSPLWGGRFGTSPAEAFQRINASIPYDARLAPYDIRGPIAHARMLGGQGIVSGEEVAELVWGLEAVLEEVEGGRHPPVPGRRSSRTCPVSRTVANGKTSPPEPSLTEPLSSGRRPRHRLEAHQGGQRVRHGTTRCTLALGIGP